MQATFSTAEKRRQALLRARNELVSFLRALLLSSAAEMGEPTKETEEEMHGRATRMRAQVLRTLATLVKHFPTALDQSSRPSSTLMAAWHVASEGASTAACNVTVAMYSKPFACAKLALCCSLGTAELASSLAHPSCALCRTVPKQSRNKVSKAPSLSAESCPAETCSSSSVSISQARAIVPAATLC